MMRNPLDTTRLVSTYQNDGLHPDAAGYKTMGESIDPHLFMEEPSSGVGQRSEDLPRTAALGQNYPNPFNPSTTISFSVPTRSFVSVKVFDSLGREVRDLVNDMQEQGSLRCQLRRLRTPERNVRLQAFLRKLHPGEEDVDGEVATPTNFRRSHPPSSALFRTSRM